MDTLNVAQINHILDLPVKWNCSRWCIWFARRTRPAPYSDIEPDLWAWFSYTTFTRELHYTYRRNKNVELANRPTVRFSMLLELRNLQIKERFLRSRRWKSWQWMYEWMNEWMNEWKMYEWLNKMYEWMIAKSLNLQVGYIKGRKYIHIEVVDIAWFQFPGKKKWTGKSYGIWNILGAIRAN